MLEKIAKWLTRKPKLVAMMAVLMLIPAAIGYISTRINYDILSYLPEDLESSHGEKLLEEPFKMAATSMLVVESMPAGYTNSLLNDIKAIDGVSNAIWISNLMGIQIPTDMIPANFRDMFFAGDATMMIIQYSHPGASDETMEAIEQVRRACNEKCFLAGFSVVIKDTRDLMDSELPIFVGLAVLLALVCHDGDAGIHGAALYLPGQHRLCRHLQLRQQHIPGGDLVHHQGYRRCFAVGRHHGLLHLPLPQVRGGAAQLRR